MVADPAFLFKRVHRKANYNRIVRLVSKTKTETGVVESAVSSAPMAQALKHDYPEVENTVRLRMREDIVTFKNQQVLQSGILLTDPSFFRVFSYRMSRGNETTALNEPFSIVLTQSTAKNTLETMTQLAKLFSLTCMTAVGMELCIK